MKWSHSEKKNPAVLTTVLSEDKIKNGINQMETKLLQFLQESESG